MVMGVHHRLGGGPRRTIEVAFYAILYTFFYVVAVVGCRVCGIYAFAIAPAWDDLNYYPKLGAYLYLSPVAFCV